MRGSELLLRKMSIGNPPTPPMAIYWFNQINKPKFKKSRGNVPAHQLQFVRYRAHQKAPTERDRERLNMTATGVLKFAVI
jgi:hypothetical protein